MLPESNESKESDLIKAIKDLLALNFSDYTVAEMFKLFSRRIWEVTSEEILKEYARLNDQIALSYFAPFQPNEVPQFMEYARQNYFLEKIQEIFRDFDLVFPVELEEMDDVQRRLFLSKYVKALQNGHQISELQSSSRINDLMSYSKFELLRARFLDFMLNLTQ